MARIRIKENEVGADEIDVELVVANGSVESALRHLLRAFTHMPVAEGHMAAYPRRHIDSALRTLQGAIA